MGVLDFYWRFHQIFHHKWTVVNNGSSAAASAVHVPFISKTSRPRGCPSQKVSWHMRASIIHNISQSLFTNIHYIYNYISSATILNFIKQTNLLLDLFGSSTKKIPSPRHAQSDACIHSHGEIVLEISFLGPSDEAAPISRTTWR